MSAEKRRPSTKCHDMHGALGKTHKRAHTHTQTHAEQTTDTRAFSLAVPYAQQVRGEFLRPSVRFQSEGYCSDRRQLSFRQRWTRKKEGGEEAKEVEEL